MRKYTFVKFLKILSILPWQSIPQGISIRLENHFSTTGENKTSQETKN